MQFTLISRSTVPYDNEKVDFFSGPNRSPLKLDLLSRSVRYVNPGENQGTLVIYEQIFRVVPVQEEGHELTNNVKLSNSQISLLDYLNPIEKNSLHATEIKKHTEEDKELLNFFNKITTSLKLPRELISTLTEPEEIRKWLKDPQNSKVKNLEELDLSRANLTYLPPEIGEFTSLKELNITHQEISNLPEEFKKLTNLNKLFASYTRFKEVPECLKNLEKLTRIALYGSSFQTPSWVSERTNLQFDAGVVDMIWA